MLRKIYQEMEAIRKELQAIRNNPQIHAVSEKKENLSGASLNKIILYADNEMFVQELRISLSAHDWYELQKQSFYQGLMKYLSNLQTQKSEDIPVLEKD